MFESSADGSVEISQLLFFFVIAVAAQLVFLKNRSAGDIFCHRSATVVESEFESA